MLCAICDHTNDTTRLCVDCREDPVNEGWTEDGDDEHVDVALFPAGALRLADLQQQRPRAVSLLRRRVMELVADYTIRVAYRPRGRKRGQVAWEWRSRPLLVAEVAWLLDREPQNILRILYDLESTLLIPINKRARERL